MKRIRSMKMLVLMSLFSIFLLEQGLIPLAFSDLNVSVDGNHQGSQLYQSDHSSDYFILPARKNLTSSAPVVLEPYLKWKCSQAFRFTAIDPPQPSYNEYIQDIGRCPAVAIVLFPFHEFL